MHQYDMASLTFSSCSIISCGPPIALRPAQQVAISCKEQQQAQQGSQRHLWQQRIGSSSKRLRWQYLAKAAQRMRNDALLFWATDPCQE
jgi:hypothetical protein